MIKRFLANKRYGFFSLMLLISTILIIVFSICASIVFYSLSSRYERSRYLKNYELAMYTLSEIIENRYLDMKILSSKLIVNNKCDPNLCELLEATSYDEVTALVRSECQDLLYTICNDDRYLRGFFLYSLSSSNLYYYSATTKSLLYTQVDSNQLPLKLFSSNAISLELTNKLINLCTKKTTESYSLYGFSTTIFNTPNQPLGYVIPLYHTSEFYNSLNLFTLDKESSFTIHDKKGNSIFDSNLYTTEEFTVNYSDSYLSNNNILTSYYVHKPSVYYQALYPIGFISFAIAFLCFMLYYITYYLSRKNIEHILSSMQAFRLSDLDYRIQVPNTNNEFTEIIKGFNTMCDELQRSVELTYLYEIQQKKSELYALQASINPHFLYNTLEMIRNQIIHGDNTNSVKMLLLLSKVHRNQTNTKIFVTLAYDLEICESLMELYQNRFQNFEYEFSIDEEASQYAIPKNTIQPLIENYFVHGLAADRLDNFITIGVTTYSKNEKKYNLISICNNGHAISPASIDFIQKKLEESIYDNNDNERGFALANVYTRLKIVFNADCEMKVSTLSENVGFRIDISFPTYTVKELEDYIN